MNNNLPEFRADLHCHSTCSDGSESPLKILENAQQIGLKGLSITDHDSVEAYDGLFPIAGQMGIELIPGVEFSAMFENISVHILGYAFDLKSAELHNFCLLHKERRESRNRLILEKLTAHDMPVTYEDVLNCGDNALPLTRRTIGRPHIALAMVKKGYVENVADAFKLHLGEDKACYVRGESFTATETIDLIHAAKGLAFIAHPHLIKETHILPKLLQMNFDGLECYYARFFKAQNERWLKLAQKKNWIMTGGSDFHGNIKPTITLGSSWTNEETFRILQNHYKTHSS